MTAVLSAVVLVSGCFPVMEAHRPAGKLLNLAADPEDRDIGEQEMDEVPSSVEDSSVENPSESARQVTFWPKKRWLGMRVDSTGSIIRVYRHRGFQAEELGLNTSQYITKVGDQKFSLAMFQKARKEYYEQSLPLNLTIETLSEGQVALRSALSYMEFPAGIVGFLLVLFLPWITYKTLASGSHVPSQTFSYPLMLVVLCTYALRAVAKTALHLLDWFDSGFVCLPAGHILLFGGLIWGVRSNHCNPLLDVQLRGDMVKEHGIMSQVAVALFVVSALFRNAELWWVAHRSELSDLFHGEAWVTSLFLILHLTLMSSQICFAGRQAMVEVLEKLPCQTSQFAEQIHTPTAKLLRDLSPQLSTLGVPLLLSGAGSCIEVFSLYKYFVYMSLMPRKVLLDPEWVDVWLHAAGYSVIMLARFLCLGLGPFQLARGLEDLEHRLSEARQSDGSLHLQVRAVEDMLAEVNHGEGWGIPVSRGLVLSKSVMQSLCVRLLLAGTVIKTFLDSELGLKDEQSALGIEQNSMQRLLQDQNRSVNRILQNITGILNETRSISAILKNDRL
mmetsp:Transcript_20695/g.49063  ORF Transcript_20695/g.49063 Transcript_20695/m.49063 type:complete len:559 (-) Transcript_20695:22-1698(-)